MGDWEAAGRWEGGLWGCWGGGGWGRCLRPSPLRTLGAVGQASLQRTIRDSKFYRVSSLAGREKEKVTCSMQQLCLPPGLRYAACHIGRRCPEASCIYDEMRRADAVWTVVAGPRELPTYNMTAMSL